MSRTERRKRELCTASRPQLLRLRASVKPVAWCKGRARVSECVVWLGVGQWTQDGGVRRCGVAEKAKKPSRPLVAPLSSTMNALVAWTQHTTHKPHKQTRAPHTLNLTQHPNHLQACAIRPPPSKAPVTRVFSPLPRLPPYIPLAPPRRPHHPLHHPQAHSKPWHHLDLLSPSGSMSLWRTRCR